MTVRTALLQGQQLLEKASVGEARLTAEVLLMRATGQEGHVSARLGQSPAKVAADASTADYGYSHRANATTVQAAGAGACN